MTLQKTLGKVGWTHEPDGSNLCYDCLIHYQAYPEERQTWNSPGAPADCEIIGVEVTRVHEYDGTGEEGPVRLLRRRPPTDEEQRVVAAAVLLQIDSETDFYRDVRDMCLEDADERDVAARDEAADRAWRERRER